MRIIFLEATQNLGGAQKSTVELAKRLKTLGHKVLVVDLWGCSQPFLDIIDAAQLESRVIAPRKEPFIIANISKIKYIKNVIKYFFLEKKYKKRFAKIVKEFKPDIVVTHNIKSMNLLNPKAAYQIDFFAREWFDFRNLTYLTKKKFKTYKPRFLTVSQATRQALFSGGIAELKNIIVLTTVIEDKIFNSYQPSYHSFSAEKPINILFSGGFLKTKGQHTCIAVAKKLKDKGIPFKMTLTGILYKQKDSERYYLFIQKLIAKHKLEDFVTIVLNPSNILDYFKNTDLLIHPSYTEGLPRVGLEALAFGKPIIANPVGGVTDIVIHNFTGFITDFNAVNQYAEYITRYVESPELYKLHSTTARQLIKQNYSDTNQFENIKRIYPTY